jgi:hypothetical protein
MKKRIWVTIGVILAAAAILLILMPNPFGN